MERGRLAASANVYHTAQKPVAERGASDRSAAKSQDAEREAMMEATENAPQERQQRQAAAASRAAAESSAAEPAPTQCTQTSSGSCIQGGEFYLQDSYDQEGKDADGDVYTCTGDTTHPHWE